MAQESTMTAETSQACHDDSSLNMSSTAAEEEALNELTAQLSNFNWKDGVVDRAKHLLYSSDISDNVKGVVNLKAMLCIGREEVYEVAQEVIDSGVINRLVYFLSIDHKELQWPAAFCLTNIAAGHDAQTQIVVKAGAIPPLINFLRHSDSRLRRQAIFCLANVAGSTSEYRIMLATHPDYFPSLLFAGDISSDARVLELVCWNLRNVCLLGGPTFEQTKAGLDYLLNNILKRYLHFHYWSGCVRYALETITSVCRTEKGRKYLLAQDLMQCLISFLENISSTSTTIAQSAIESTLWLLLYGTIEQKRIFVRVYPRLINSFQESISGTYGNIIQELSLKCLCTIALLQDKEFLLSVLESNHQLIFIIPKIYMDVYDQNHIQQQFLYDQNSHQNNNQIHMKRKNNNSISVITKECSAFLFIKLFLLIRYIPELHNKLSTLPEVISIILHILDFSLEILKYKLYQNEQKSHDVHVGPSLFENTPAILLVSTLNTIVEHIHLGDTYRLCEELPTNPILLMYKEQDLSAHLKNIFNTVNIPQEAFELSKQLLEQSQD